MKELFWEMCRFQLSFASSTAVEKRFFSRLSSSCNPSNRKAVNSCESCWLQPLRKVILKTKIGLFFRLTLV
ncbi:hypothetical protein MHBO_002990 [Bonamia ostreae]|uniref:HAT C-terminal dimerisation domain-containing protein n=1 Tax=Bonamia ostreae TaxID=126728 RepID=A0ABV2AP48_9EUKA